MFLARTFHFLGFSFQCYSDWKAWFFLFDNHNQGSTPIKICLWLVVGELLGLGVHQCLSCVFALSSTAEKSGLSRGFFLVMSLALSHPQALPRSLCLHYDEAWMRSSLGNLVMETTENDGGWQ